MKRFATWGLLVLAICLSPAMAFAQATGQIAGNVFDQNGMPLKGVKVMAKSETDIAPKTVYSNDEGYFRIIGLMPGKFDVTAASPGLQTYIQKNVAIGVSSVAELTIVMEVKTDVEEFTIISKAPVVNTKSAATTEKFDDEFLNSLPLEDRTAIQGVLANQVAGAVGNSSSPQFRGGTSTQNSYQLEGFQINDVGGGRGQVVTFRTIAALEISTGGYGAENANAAGAVMNAVTRSGSNRYEAEISGWHENTRLRFFQDDLDPRTFGMNNQLSLDVSGPIIKDRLWFYTTFEGRNDIANRARDPLGLRATPPRGSENALRGGGKLTYQITPRNKLQAVYSFNRTAGKNQNGSLNADRDAQTKNEVFDYFVGLIWESVLTDSLIFRSQIGRNSFSSEFGPEICRTDPENCDHISSLRQLNPVYEYQNSSYHNQNFSQTLEFKNTLQFFSDSKTFGNHDLKLTARFYGAQLENRETTPGDSIYVFDGTSAFTKRQVFVNDPTIEDGRFGWAISNSSSRTIHLSLSDQFRLPGYRYLTISPGVAGFNTIASDGAGNDVLKFNTATPHIQAAWDITHDGRTVVRGGFNQYVDVGNLNVSNFAGASRTVKVCEYDSANKTYSRNCAYTGGRSRNTVGLPCGPQGIDANGNDCSTKLGTPRTWEYMLGAEREIVQGISLGSDFQYRKYNNPYEDLETNYIWDKSGQGLDPTGQFRNGRNFRIFDLETPDSAKRRYMGIVTSVKKREGALRVNFSYQWSRLTGNVVDGFRNPYLDNPVQDLLQDGSLPGDSRHVIRTQMTYMVNAWLSAGYTFRFDSGTPVQLIYYNRVTNLWGDFRARRGFHPGRNINDPFDDFEYRLPDQMVMGAQIRANLKPITRFNAEFFVDILNMLALRTTVSVSNQATAPDVGIQNGRLPPLYMRAGFRFKY
ncbi:MAG: carboxypeptidase regulatory-like domain-containing protein [Deltaproteobacteria bacterium]|nr:carboxypeptidase regulatory-like domain-containing protein [Deltaproteobacteria bacterium]